MYVWDVGEYPLSYKGWGVSISPPISTDWTDCLRQASIYLRTFGLRLELPELIAPTYSYCTCHFLLPCGIFKFLIWLVTGLKLQAQASWSTDFHCMKPQIVQSLALLWSFTIEHLLPYTSVEACTAFIRPTHPSYRALYLSHWLFLTWSQNYMNVMFLLYISCALCLSYTRVIFKFCFLKYCTGDWTWVLKHIRQALYHWAISSAFISLW